MTTITGNNQDNLLEGTDADEIILAAAGDDTVNAGGGDDWVFAGNGDDSVDAGEGDDRVSAGDGDDTVDVGEGDDIVFAGKGNDTVIHVEGDNPGSQEWYFGQQGMDTLRLVVSQETLDSAAFQQELAAFQAMIDAGGSAWGHFSTLDIHFASFEKIEVVLDNQPPTSISLSNDSVFENEPGAVIGTLSATDPNGDAGLTFTLVDDFGIYEIDGTTLKLKEGVSLDREGLFIIPPPVVQVTDPGGLTYTQEFAIEILDVDEAPQVPAPNSGISVAFVPENTPGAVYVSFGARDPEGEPLTWTVSDSRFEVVGTGGIGYRLKLKDGISLDYETEPDVAVTVTASDPGGMSDSHTFHLAVVDGAPTGISLDNNSVEENAFGTEIGNLTITDPDGDTEFNISVDDTRFEVVDGALKLVEGESLDFETEPTVSVAVTASGDGLGFTQTFDIMVNDVNEAPTAIALDNDTVAENAAGAVIGNLTASDPDGETAFTYSVDDDRFEVVGGALKLVGGQSLDFENEPTVTVNVTAEDAGGLSLTETFDIHVDDVDEAPVLVAFPTGTSPSVVEYNILVALIAVIGATDPELGLELVLSDLGLENTPGANFGVLVALDPDGEPLTVQLSDPRFEAVQLGQLVSPDVEITPELEPLLSSFHVVKPLDGEIIDYETEPNVTITVTATDGAGLTASATLNVPVQDVNEAPTAIVLDNDTVDENAVGAVIGNLTVADPDGDTAFDFAVDDARFEVAGGMLKLKAGESLDFEEAAEIALDITAIDPGDLSHTQTFVIDVIDVPEPEGLVL